jgi:hypothetical protein
MTIDHGGVEDTVTPGQLDFGMGMFTILDGDLPLSITNLNKVAVKVFSCNC